ncbi:hypothetical protein BUALT_BualtMtG0008700 (mitochondrion) [Buddleja alternifolia]|uniref:Uncharacterized protein n=1 Tax=Buddleja alternifolia TaxID=168488 RepID=A0AAV6W3G0_9LAMI|nr:hypothetical protein BUALT_BualtUnG0044500 [Buddleja alternifolia]KAG8363148.1 hypothetical protein BUALT_BualtMtG0000700 [Buddleja alternifolia]KAG8363199.1 hypothetical protein BUALT_BualtMtG0008700 [Buddleja alternifolia]
MSLKQSDSVLSLFSFWIPRMSRAILTSLSEDDEASSSDKDVSDATRPARTTFSIFLFLASSVRRDKREILSISQKQIPPPPMLPRSAYRGIERKDPGPEQVGLG